MVYKNFDIIVVGGGLVGLTFILDMARRNFKLKLAVIDNKPFQKMDNNVIDNKIYAISSNNVNYLKMLSVWPDENIPDQQQRIGTIKTMDVYGDDNSNLVLSKDDAYQTYLAKTIEYNYLQQHILDQIAKYDNIQIIYDQLNSIDRIDNNQLKLNGCNNTLTATLIVGGDGASSFVRRSMGIEFSTINYHQYGIVANFACEKPHNNIARQWFINGKILAYLPMPDNRISIVFSCGNYNELLEMTDQQFSDHVAQSGAYSMGKLHLIGKPEAFPLKLYLLNKVWQDNLVLIGDAAHTIHPLAGQGVNLGFADAQLLANKLARLKNYQFGDSAVLGQYNAERFFAVKKMQYTCHVLQRLFGVNNIFVRNIRNHGLNLVNRLPLLKRFLISSAM